jgi:hypothetical protein
MADHAANLPADLPSTLDFGSVLRFLDGWFGSVSDTRDPSYSYIDRVIWAVLVIVIIGIGWLIVSNL